MKLPSIIDTDSIFANDDLEYVFNNDNDLPENVLVNNLLPLHIDYAKSFKIPGTEEPGFSPIIRNKAFPNGLKWKLTNDLNTFHKVFESCAKRFSNDPCISHHEYDYENEQHLEQYKSETFDQIHQRKNNLASGLFFLLESNPFLNYALESHQKIRDHSKIYKDFDKDNTSFIVTFYSGNRREWIISDLACSSNSITSTALYDTLGAGTGKYILELTESPVIICSKDKIENLINLKKNNFKQLESLILIISIDPLLKKDKHLIDLANEQHIKVYEFTQVEKIGEIFPKENYEPSPETVYTITFTSGTTGANPKGVVLAQKTVTAAISNVLLMIPHHKNQKEFAFLPLAHIFERQMCVSTISMGGNVALPRLGGSALTLVKDLKLFKPHFFACVPRIFSRIEQAIKSAIPDSDKPDFKFTKPIVKKIRSQFGFDEIERGFTGGGPTSPETVKFLQKAFQFELGSGYGSSESFGGLIMASSNHHVGSDGPIGASCEARLKELPEMNYKLNQEDGDKGELQLRGFQMFSHYYKNPEETAKSIDSNGWFDTGDVAHFRKDGYFKIIDRVKNFYKLAQGEYVTPEKIENLYLTTNSIITQIYTHGDSLKTFLVGIVGIDPMNIKKYLQALKIHDIPNFKSNEEMLEFINKREVKTRILLNFNSNLSDKLNGFEKIQNLYFEIEPLTLERQVITPTSKLKRPIAQKFFKKQIDSMYEEGSIIKDLKL
ncbi:unnamed protein product [Candida verbasci]|uniref:AMP-dependent synthetase/ligase domain-containing protein n=1 Tax=Candida verbasci TaxID=1227364 RepID=A0A9W4TZG1_9ASCO|nr:unnamed protein product [Candida verbasci]